MQTPMTRPMIIASLRLRVLIIPSRLLIPGIVSVRVLCVSKRTYCCDGRAH
jgi:hypothetical protein